MIKAQNLDDAAVALSQKLKYEGVSRKTRGYDCIEIPHPVFISIDNPLNRYVTVPGRKASKTLPFGESLALLSGVNDISLYADYAPNVLQYSDDGETQRAGYGPRIRSFVGLSEDYVNKKPFDAMKGKTRPTMLVVSDQFRYVIETLQRDPDSRQAVISITDPAVDQFGPDGKLIETKDIPCCRIIQFMIVDGKLDCTSYFRSNDILYGFQQVNVFNNTFMQECVAMILGVPVGKYYHFANNMHFYRDKIDILQNNIDQDKVYKDIEGWQGYGEKFTLKTFDLNIQKLFDSRGKEERFESDFFQDWSKVFLRFHQKDKSINFVNPYLNRLFNRPVFTKGAEFVKVLQADKTWKFYEVYKPMAYLEECKRDGKIAKYCGRADRFGYLNK